MGDIFSRLSQPDSTSSQTAATAPHVASATMSSSDSPHPEQPKPINQESDIPIGDPPIDTKTVQIEQNPSEKETLLGKDTEESKSPNQGAISGEDLNESIKDGNSDTEGEEEEEGECGFCLFMKEGGCKETFVDWEKCVEEGEKNQEDIVEKCFQATAALKKCMEVHSDYYAPLLQAEKAAEEEAAKQLEEEKERSSDGEESAKKENGEISTASDQVK